MFATAFFFGERHRKRVTVDQMCEVSVQGNIGAGKSSVLAELRKLCPQVQVVEEDVDTWSSFAGTNLLSAAYKSPSATFQLQLAVMVTRMEQLQRWMDEGVVVLTERSMDTDMFCFVKMHAEKGRLTAVEHELYQRLYQVFRRTLRPSQRKVVYLRCPPATCLQRVKRRMRSSAELSGVTLDYLQELDRYHDEWLRTTPHTVLDADKHAPRELAKMIQSQLL